MKMGSESAQVIECSHIRRGPGKSRPQSLLVAAGGKGSADGGLEGFGHAVVLVGARGPLVSFGQPLSRYLQSTT